MSKKARQSNKKPGHLITDRLKLSDELLHVPGGTRRKKTTEFVLSDYGFKVGDIVAVGGQGLNTGGIAYRITRDNPPRGDARWGTYYVRYAGRKRKVFYVPREGFLDPKKGRPIAYVHLRGSVLLEPVFWFLPWPWNSRTKRPKRPISKTVAYGDIPRRLRRIDLTELGEMHQTLQSFIATVVNERS